MVFHYVFLLANAVAIGYLGRRLRAALAESRRQAEDLSRIGERYRLAMSSTQMGTWDFDFERQRFVCDERGCELLGIVAEAEMEVLLAGVIPEDRGRVETALREALNLKAQGLDLEFRVALPDGTRRWLRIKGVTHFNVPPHPRRVTRFIGTVADITGLKAAEQEAERHASLFRTIAESIPHMIWTDGPQGIEYFSPRGLEYLGVDLEGIRGLKILEFIHPEDQDALARTWSNALAKEQAYQIESRMRAVSGDYRWFLMQAVPQRDEQGRVVQWFGTTTDIQRSKEAEAALRQSEERFRILAENIAQLVWIADDAGQIQWANRQWMELTGFSEEELKGEGWMKAVPENYHERLRSKVQESIRTGTTLEDTVPIRSRNGEECWFLMRAVGLYDTAGRPVRWLGTGTDVTEKQRAEEALRSADRRKDEFLAMLAHELRNPLAPIRNAVHLLRLPGIRDEAAARQREMIDRQVTHMAHLLDDLLDVSRITRGKISLNRQPVSVAEILRRAADDTQPLIAGRRHQFEVSLPPAGLLVNGDFDRLTQVVENLLTNAAKYTPEGGRIRLSAGREAAWAVIVVRDNGVGMEPELLDRIFELFVQGQQTLERSQGGLGIGLTIVRQLVEMHGGTVEARSPGLGQGSEFTVRLPAWTQAKTPVRGAVAGAYGNGARHRVLVVEDVADTADSLAELLRAWGHQARPVYDGAAAVRIGREFQPDVVLLDIGLPGLNGYELARQLRRSNPGLHILAISGYGQEPVFQEARQAGIEEYFVKPVNLEVLRKRLSR